MSNNNYDSIKLVAVSPPIDVYGRVRNEPVTLVLRENLYADSPTDYAICDLNGDVVVTLKAKNHSVTNKRRAVRDSRQDLHRPRLDGRQEGGRAAVQGRGRSGSEQTMELDGDWAGDGAVLSFYDKSTKKPTQPVAKASRKSMTVKPGAYDDQTYFFTVAPGIDIALMAGIAVCFDEIRRGLEYGG
ncbi:hypothetical protein A1Q1_06581 [Trichosporon asahii var. asahii CBS 2479]|uniref:Tubby C-terminal-like domain-containing protein n=1 Tax=Trichosporon asahii var. asahii (strain ATCC 90039 / CBS 2479 / JCM 2466 / KCTC 7840 / NBRC 103889/ NCYC 2677 / UAMH 7654) TaxID=1186058 RepID=J6ELB3_TRIAS|nr:hypothetical protein A1Q1_06581 [Trichosporon asahii var. asahii CBS 2479]EJT45049.1 hypothetical protein A1Q1_06581 [Trichosporon asahii var. asahii CBS 2479]